MRSSAARVRPSRCALRRATAGDIAISPRYAESPLPFMRGATARRSFVERQRVAAVRRRPAERAPFPSPSAGNDSTSVDPRFPRYAAFQRDISVSPTKHTETASAGIFNFLRTREKFFEWRNGYTNAPLSIGNHKRRAIAAARAGRCREAFCWPRRARPRRTAQLHIRRRP